MQDAFHRDAATIRVIEELKRLYKTKILPLEQYYRFDLFHSPPLSDAEFDAKPQVMLIGQYSVGKTSFIRYLLGKDFPGQRIGPEPTTDKFVAVFDGPDERIIPGNALAVSHDMPFRGLERFGVSFLNRFEGSQVPSNVLKSITLIDTPGVLSGEKQRVARGYDFTQICTWFAERADLILLLFDAHKLDISDEFRSVMEGLKGNDDKIRCVLNKADQVDRQRLMRVYGALMWSLGKVIKTPEVLRVYIGTFWDQPLLYDDNATLFEMEEKDLMKDLKDLPRNSAIRKINELVKRVRICKVHAYLISYLRDQMPTFMGHSKKQAQLMETMSQVFRTVMKKYNLAPGDFPDIADFKSKLAEVELQKFPALKQKLVDDVDSVLGFDFPRLMEALPRALEAAANASLPSNQAASLSPAIATPVGHDVTSNKGTSVDVSSIRLDDDDTNPWASEDVASSSNSAAEDTWALATYLEAYKAEFMKYQVRGQISGAAAKPVLSSSGLPMPALKKIWDLSDVNKDGSLNLEEFVVAKFLIDMAKQGHDLPSSLDEAMIPPGKYNL